MKFIEKNLPLIAVLVVAMLMLLPFLGLSEFNTKGEPREAVVALSMLKEGDWILPVNNGVDIPYKPPFFHYCIALVSLLLGGINEYTSRLPSAMALIALAVGCFAFYRRRLSTVVALSASLLLLTSFEVHRAGVSCRVDMMLTVLTVASLLLFYRWWERGGRGVPFLAVLCMSGAVLTKGPVGFIVPCFVMVVFTLLRGGKLWSTLARYAGFAALSCVLPAVWYVAAWHEGGQDFLNLVYEENIGRMTGSMSYESHTHSFPYNFFTLATGWLPWTLLVVISLFAKPWKRKKPAAEPKGLTLRQILGRGTLLPCSMGELRVRIMTIPPVKLFTWLAFLLVLFFYCLPSSKRSVYLLPCYPFMAVIIAQYVEYLWKSGRRSVLRVYICVVAVLAVALTLAFAAVRMGFVPDTIFHGKHAADNVAMLHALRDNRIGLLAFVLAALPLISALDCMQLAVRRKTRDSRNVFYFALFAPVVLLTMALDGVYQPAVLNTKSLRPMAECIAATFPGEPLYQYVDSRMMHFFGADFYLDDSLKQFEAENPSHGALVVPVADFAALAKRHPDYRFTLVRTLPPKASEVKSEVALYRFIRK